MTRNCSTSSYNPNGICDKKKVNPIFASTNRIEQNQDGTNDYLFDNGGNTTKDASGNTYIYDAENKQIEVKNSSNQTIGQYWYDGDGKRVKKYVPSTGETTLFVYDASGKMVAEYSTIVASQQDAQVSYLANDHLGSPRIITDENGAVTSRRDFQPFGEEISTSQRISQLGYNTDNIRQKFTSYERDNETELDFAQARMYANKLGRFTTPDDFLNDSDMTDPQSWGKYIYVRNNPLNFTDPTGQCTPTPGNPCIRVLPISGVNHVPKQPKREVSDAANLGFKDTPSGGFVLINVESQFAEGDNIADYKHVRSAIILGDGIIRKGGEENPSSDQTSIEGNSRFVTDNPGVSTQVVDSEGNTQASPKSILEGKSFAAIFVAGEYNKKTKQLSENVAYYGVQLVYGKDGKIDQEKSKVVSLTKDQFIELAKQSKVKLPKDKDKKESPEKLLSPPN